MDSRTQLSKMTVLLHWGIAFAIIGMLAFGMYLEELPRSPEKGELMAIHKSLGVLLLILASFRFIHRLIHKMPPPVEPLTAMQEKVALATHGFLLLATLFMPISGIMMTLGGGRSLDVFGVQLIAAGDKVEWLGDLGGLVHGFGSTLLIAVILLHVAAGLKHKFIHKDATMERMFGQRVD